MGIREFIISKIKEGKYKLVSDTTRTVNEVYDEDLHWKTYRFVTFSSNIDDRYVSRLKCKLDTESDYDFIVGRDYSIDEVPYSSCEVVDRWSYEGINFKRNEING